MFYEGKETAYFHYYDAGNVSSSKKDNGTWGKMALKPFDDVVSIVKEIMNSGTYLASEFGRQKKPFTKIEFIAVAKEHQGQGYMRQMMSSGLSLPVFM